MLAVIVIGLLFAAVVVARAAFLTFSRQTAYWLKVLCWGSFSAAAIAAYFTTFQYIRLVNENTEFHGWPVPAVVYQRDSPTEPWLDFIGPTIVVAFPINFILFLFLPSVIVLLLARRSNSSKRIGGE